MSSDPDEVQTKSFLSRIYKTSRSPGALLFDIHPVRNDYDVHAAMVVLREQHPTAFGCVPMKDGNKHYLEVYSKNVKEHDHLKEVGLRFTKSKLTILPCTARNDTSKVVTLKLSNVPMFPQVLEGLERSLKPFREILDIGLHVHLKSRHFMGQAYAVLDIGQDEKEYQTLRHTINYDETNDSFQLTWSNMPTWCRYCHAEGHTKTACALANASIICYYCHTKGHRSFECPRKAASVEHKKRKKEESESQALDRAVPRETPSAPVSSKPMVGATVELPPPVTDSISPPVDDEVTPPTDQSLSDVGSEEDSSEYDPIEDPQASIDTEEKVTEEQTVEEDIEITEV